MRNSKKFLAVVIAVAAMLTAMCVSVSAASKFSDVSASDETLTKAVSLLSYLEVAKGTSDTTFGTSENVTRQQMAAFIYRLVKSGKSLEGGENQTSFTDLRDSTYFAYVSWANSTGVIKGRSATEFDPLGSITLQDAYTMLIRALGYEQGDTELEYPYDYIDIAEGSKVDLGDGLPSTVTYTTPLTRGNVAVLLYNAFFAETGYAKTESKEKLIGVGSEKPKYVIVKETVYPTTAEYFYDVEQGTFSVKATPHYAFNDSETSTNYKPLLDEFDVDTLQFVATESDEPIQEFYREFADLGVSGKADDYIMAEFDIYYTVDKDDENKVDLIFYADGGVNKITSDNMTLGKVSAKKKTDYFNGDTSYPKLDGSGKVDSTTVYFFDAPYDYLKPSYGNITDTDEAYALRNEKDVRLISLKTINANDNTYGYYITDDDLSNAENLGTVLNQVYTSGIYRIDLYDADGDGVYEYMRYMPATFGRADADEGHYFKDVAEHAEGLPIYIENDDTHADALPTVPTIYTNEADITGAGFNDLDYIFAYLNADANEIYVFARADKTVGTISYVNENTATIKCNNKTFRTCYAFLTVKGFTLAGGTDNDVNLRQNAWSSKTEYFKSQLLSASALDNDFALYTYNKNQNNVYFFDPLSASGASYSGSNIIIPLADENGNRGVTTEQFNSKTSQNDQYLKVWVDGKEKYVPVETDDTYPAPKKVKVGYDFGVTVKEDDGNTYPAYLGKLCTYVLNSDGTYEITSLFHNRDEDGNFKGVNNDPTTLVEKNNKEEYGRDLDTAEEARITKVAGTRYRLEDALGYSLLGTDDVQYIEYFIMNSETKIIIRNQTDDDEFEYLQYDMNSFKGSTSPDTMLTNVQYVLRGDPDSTSRAYMLILYGEAENFEFETKTSTSDWRIIKDTTPGTDDDGNYRNYYDLFDPFDGKIIENVAGSKTVSKADSLENYFDPAIGHFVKMTTDGYVNENKTDYDVIDVEENTKLAFITDYSDEDGVLEIKPVNEEDAGKFAADPNSGLFVYNVTEDTKISVITLDSKTKFNNGTISAVSAKDLVKPKNSLLCYNDKVFKKEGDTKYTTKYSEYVKCYISYTESNDPDERPEVDYIVILVHPDEKEAFLKK